MKINDMPKLESPFVRKDIAGRYLVTPEIAPGYEWVFDDPFGRICVSMDNIAQQRKARAYVARFARLLRGKNLACWCRIGTPCHGDVPLRVAEGKSAQ